ncbi:MAG: putative metal-binding motif-containing protein, partial [Myxococcota bacterium]
GCVAASDGGAIEAVHADVGISASTFTANVAGRGGAVAADNAAVAVAGTVFTANVADPTYGLGGGMYATAADVTVTGGSFDGNSAERGGGAWLDAAAGVFDWVSFDDNTAETEGSGVATTEATIWVNGSRFDANTVPVAADPAFGGAIDCRWPASCFVDRSWFEGNVAPDGGAISSDGELGVTRSMFCANEATSDGGAIDVGNLVYGGPVTIAASVFAENHAAADGGAVVVTDGVVELLGDHFVGNEASRGGAVGSATLGGLEGLTLRNVLVAGNRGLPAVGIAGVWSNESWDWFWDNGAVDLDVPASPTTNLGEDPELAGPNGCDPASLAPTASSPLIDGGDPQWTDPNGSRADIGAFGGPDADYDAFLDLDGDGDPGMLDCDDRDPAVSVGAVEVCNGIDDDCDGLVDADDRATDAGWLHRDDDGDGYGTWDSAYRCPGPGWATPFTDCDDAAQDVHPLADDVAGDGFDADCDGEDTPDPDPTTTGPGGTTDPATDPADPSADSDGDGVLDGAERPDAAADPGGTGVGDPPSAPVLCGCDVGEGPGASGWVAGLAGLAALGRRPGRRSRSTGRGDRRARQQVTASGG